MNTHNTMLRAILVVALVGVLAGCGSAEEREAESVARQEAQMVELGAQIEEWGEAILAQIPEEEIERMSEDRGADPRELSDYFDPWPQYQTWDAFVQLKPEGARTPLEMADDLEPWLLSEGWKRSDGGRDEVTKAFVDRMYGRDGYRLSVRADTEPPPQAQNLTFGMSSPPTTP